MDKPTKKIKRPVIRQTKTSIYRMAKANPLLVRENQIKVADKDVNLPLAVTYPGRITLDDIEFKKWIQTSTKASSSNNSLGLPPQKKEVIPMTKANVKKATNMRPKPNLPVKNKPLIKSASEDNGKQGQGSNMNENFKMPLSTAPKKTQLRRSLSSEYFANTNKPITKCFGSANETLNKSLSFQSLNSNTSKSGLHTFSKFLSYRSTSTPMCMANKVRKNVQESPLNTLQHPLKEWLKQRGKSLSNYQHLKCFGMQQLRGDERNEEKENIPEVSPRSGSYDDLKIPVSAGSAADDQKAFAENLVTGAVEDLHNLIVTGYSPEQCEAWLDFIKQKSKNMEEKPQYWECRAAIEQRRGNIASAVECYKNSIINGANVDHIDESLGHLLEKFSLLNIEAKNPVETEKRRKAKEEEVRNIFKSTIIQFAIKERSLNKKDNTKEAEKSKKQFTGTPVRRSTRKSCAKFQHTPGKTLYDSWSDVDNSIKENVEFKNNAYLA
ncbi:LOW QUALITY PROTEIN: uncharacterized protein [Atheta coriaria]|uniref:LOW QUALITY PROTEIN: uncharacterized protein n=1 Tax=Dalotia coriaria TaxID=877792 RepID=UPI0031F449A5